MLKAKPKKPRPAKEGATPDYFILYYLEERPDPAVGYEVHQTLVASMEDGDALKAELERTGRKNIKFIPGSYVKEP